MMHAGNFRHLPIVPTASSSGGYPITMSVSIRATFQILDAFLFPALAVPAETRNFRA